MSDGMTVADVLARVRKRRNRKQCPDCEGVLSIRGYGGEYWWTCLGCDAIGIGFQTREDALTEAERSG